LYYKRFGKQKYVIPYLLLISLIIVVSIMIAISATYYLISDPLSQYMRPWPVLATLMSYLITGPSSQYILPWPALAALSGAYVWLLNDFIAKARYRDVAPSDLLWGATRLIACVPLGYAVGVIANREIMPFLAFGLGAFDAATYCRPIQ
jgi:hypothetical protein